MAKVKLGEALKEFRSSEEYQKISKDIKKEYSCSSKSFKWIVIALLFVFSLFAAGLSTAIIGTFIAVLIILLVEFAIRRSRKKK